MATPSAPRSRSMTPWWFAPLMLLIPGIYVAVLIGGAIAAVISGSSLPGFISLGQAFVVVKRLLGGAEDPASAWLAPNELHASPTAVWVGLGVAGLLYAAVVVAVYIAIDNRRADRLAAARGFADEQELRRRGLTENRAVAQAKLTTKRLKKVPDRKIDPYREAVFLGHSVAGRTRHPVFIQHNDGVLIHGPTGAGKTWRLAVPLIFGAPGFVLVTSTKADVLAATLEYRLGLGRVMVFDPESITGWPAKHKLRWSLLAGCKDPEVALRRARALVQAMPMGDTKNASYWDGKATTLMRCYLHAAALSGRSLADVQLWTAKRSNETVLEILRDGGRKDWAAELDQILSSHSDSTDDMIGSAARLLEPLSSPALRAAMEATAEESCDLEDLIFNGTNALYLHSTYGEESSAAAFTSVLAAEVYYLAHRESQRRHESGRRLDPYVRLILDEVNNVAPIPALPHRITDSGGRGISIYAFAHNRLQNKDRWGDHAGEMFTTNSPVRILLPGLGDPNELEDIARLTGEAREWVADADGRTTLQTNKVMSGSDIRQMDTDKALMLYRGAKPIVLHLPTVYDFPESKARVESSERLFSKVIESGEIPSVPAMSVGGFVAWNGRS